MNIYQKELQSLKAWDEIQGMGKTIEGYDFIYTAGHGYLVVPTEDKNYHKAKDICRYGFIGQHAVYLEEDVEKWQFLDNLN